MKSLLIFLVSFNAMQLSSSKVIQNEKFLSKESSILAESVHWIVNEIFSKETATSNFISFSKNEGHVVNDFIDEVLQKFMNNYKVLMRQYSVSDFPIASGHRKHSSVIIVSDFEDFINFHKNLSPKNFRFNGYYAIVLVEGLIPEIDKIFELSWRIQIYNIIVLFEDKSETVIVKTFFPFRANNCSDTSSVTVHNFKNGSFSNKSEIFPQKNNNLHNCEVRVSILKDAKPFVKVDHLSNGSRKIYGEDISILNALAEHLNFKINYTFIGVETYAHPNGSFDGPLNEVLNGRADLSISNWWLKVDRLKLFDSTTSYMNEKVMFVVPPGREFTTFEKLILPFSLNLWILILVCLITGFITILIVKFGSEKVQSYVFGSGVKTPSLNIIAAFLGGNQVVLPRKHFARILLTVFLIYSLVIRTIYQGSYYQFLQSDARQEHVQTLDEMISKGFKFAAHRGMADWLLNLKSLENKVVTLQIDKVDGLLEKIRVDPYLKMVFGAPLTVMFYKNSLIAESERFIIGKDVFLTMPVVIYSQKDFYLLNSLNNLIENLKASGLTDYWHFQGETFSLRNVAKQPKVLNLIQLSGCFEILAFGYFASFLVFFVEKISALVKNYASTN